MARLDVIGNYEELRDIFIDVISNEDPPKTFNSVIGQVAEKIRRNITINHGFIDGAPATLSEADQDIAREIFWDLFRQGVITLGNNSSNDNWPFFKITRFGRKVLEGENGNRFHDVDSYIKIVKDRAPDLSAGTAVYLKESVASFYSGCLLASVVMLGVAAESEFLKLVELAVKKHPTEFGPVNKEISIRQKILRFQKGLESHSTLLKPKNNFESLNINFDGIQSVIRSSRNDAGHPSGAPAPSRELVFSYLHLFPTYARQVMHLRQVLT